MKWLVSNLILQFWHLAFAIPFLHMLLVFWSIISELGCGSGSWVYCLSGNAALSVAASTGIMGKRLQPLLQVNCHSLIQFLRVPRSGSNPKLLLWSSVLYGVLCFENVAPPHAFSRWGFPLSRSFNSLMLVFRGFRPFEVYYDSSSLSLVSCRSSQVAWMAHVSVFKNVWLHICG